MILKTYDDKNDNAKVYQIIIQKYTSLFKR